MSEANLQNVTAGLMSAFAFESITVSASVKKLTLETLKDSDGNALRAIITTESAQIRWTYDGTTPTSSVGHLANPFTTIILMTTSNIKNFRAIRASSSNATIRVTYEH